MKLKKFLTGLGTLCLALMLFMPLSVHAQENTGATTIKTSVPLTHTVMLDIGEHGSVLINGTSYTYKDKDKEAKIERLAEQKYIIQADDGWQIESVLYGKTDAQEKVNLIDNAFTAPIINSDDNKLTVTFKKISGDGSTAPDKGGNANTGVQTGDTSNIMLWSVIALISCLAVAKMYTVRHRKENN